MQYQDSWSNHHHGEIGTCSSGTMGVSQLKRSKHYCFNTQGKEQSSEKLLSISLYMIIIGFGEFLKLILIYYKTRLVCRS